MCRIFRKIKKQQMSKILLIGSDGYIGSKLKLSFLGLTHQLTSVDLGLFNTNSNTLILDYNTLSKEFLQDFDVVILLAGHSSVKMCEGDIKYSYYNNVDNFIKIVSKLNKKTKFIYASSSSVYGKCNTTATEDYREFTPYNNYDVTKHMIDMYIERCDIEYYGLRFGTVNGYSPVLRDDVMINAMYCNSLKNGQINLYIKNIMRPILGIEDLIRAIFRIIDCKTDLRGIYNLASFNKSAEEIANEVGRIINVPVIEYETNPNDIIINSKLQTVCYDFKIDTTKFEKTFDFKFYETIETIVKGLQSNNFKQTNRSKIFKYEKN